MDLLLSDFDNFSENSSYEDQDDAEFMYGGQARSILSSLEETIGKIDDFLSFERGFIYGDIVCLVTDPSGQTGRVINVDMIVDLENVDGKKIDNVNSKKLRKIRSVSVGDYVVNGPWLGKVDKIVDYVTILFDDGRKCEFTTMGPEKLVPISPDLLEDSQYPYYPGQRVQVEPSSVVKSSRRLCGTWKEKRDEGTVCAVEAGLVYVDWLACALVGGEKVPAPPSVQDSKNLTLLSCFSHANWQLGDWCMLPLHEYNCVTEKFSLKASTCGLTKGHHQPAKAFQRSLEPNFQEIFVIARTKTKVDVLWQDGSQSFGLDSHLLIPVNITDAHDFWPEQFVLEKGNSDDLHASGVQKWGVVRCVDAKERTMRVKWRSFTANQATDLKEELVEETMSAYELIEHPEYSYFFGEVVFRLQKGQFVDLPDGKSYGNSYLSCIGIVVGFKDGDVEVKWASGHTTKVAPHEIFRLDKYEDLSATPVLHEEMTEHDNQSLGQKGKALLDSNGDSKYGQKSSWVSSSFSLPQAAIGFFTSIASSLFGSSGFTSLLGTSDHVFEDGQQSGISSEEEVGELSNLCTVGPTLAVADWPKVEEIQDNREIPFSSGSKHQELFKQFDMVSGCSDHHFVDGAGKGLISSQVKRGWLKKVQQEWSILEKDLPETIYVRIYEERMDLIRAAIVGAPGTPYHDGLFIFDIFLPPDYPHEPPLVHYNSGGLRVNPNLYESGKVCLSLLNTWTGTGTETWSPENSTILQVLLSLQALVLNEKPYFNEAGYDKQMGRAEGEKNSVSYNENAFLVSSKTMLHLMRKPPKHFEVLVEEHFSRRSEYIILACKAYMEGVPVGCAFGHENAEEENQKGSSTGFKIMLAKLFPMLVEAFSDKGIDCSKYIESPK